MYPMQICNLAEIYQEETKNQEKKSFDMSRIGSCLKVSSYFLVFLLKSFTLATSRLEKKKGKEQQKVKKEIPGKMQ